MVSRQARVVLILLTVTGCALGGIFRYLGMTLITRLAGERFPWGTFIVNALGSFLLGLFIGGGTVSDGFLGTANGQALVAVGFSGGLTTFSTFSLQTFSLVAEQAWGKALTNILGSVLICVVGVLSGYALGEGWMA
jgi:CrcB protein